MSMIGIRQWHSYVGLFIAPSVLFFTLTGAVQIYNLHEAHGSYEPPAVLEKLSSVHKDQVFALGDHHEPPAAPEATAGKPDVGPAAPAAAEDADKPKLPTLMLKGFFCIVALCLAVSTALGLWMGLTQTRRKRTGWLLVIAGAVIPVGLLLIS